MGRLFRSRRATSAVALATLVAPALLAVGVGVGGCGGGSKEGAAVTAPTRAATGGVGVRIVWPAPVPSPTRLIPSAAQSIRVTLAEAGTGRVVATAVAARPPSGSGVSELSLRDLSPGPLRLTATAHPVADGSGTIQASGIVDVVIVSDEIASASVTMDSVIDRLEIGPTPVVAYTGRETPFTATARNAAGEVVLTSPGTLRWSTDTPGVLSTSQDGRVTGVDVGEGRITVLETESGKSTTATVTVRRGDGYFIPARYTVTALPLPPGVAFASLMEALGLNDSGAVVGYWYDATLRNDRPFLWENGVTRALETEGATFARAYGINNRGQAVGLASYPLTSPRFRTTALLWQEGRFIPLPNPDPTGQYAYATTINDSGQIAGPNFQHVGSTGATWTVDAAGNISASGYLPVFFGPMYHSGAINASGTVAGAMLRSTGPSQAAISSGSSVILLSSTSSNSEATGINAGGEVVGFTGFRSSSERPALWRSNGERIDLGMPAAWSRGLATDISDTGLVVGVWGDTGFPGGGYPPNPPSSTAAAFVWGRTAPNAPEQAVDLNTLIPANSGWVLLRANAINDRGEIVGVGRRNGVLAAFLLAPAP